MNSFSFDTSMVELGMALEYLPEHVFNKVKETVDGDNYILVGKWVGDVDGKPYGCLMCDGLSVCEPESVLDLINHPEGMSYDDGPHIEVLLKFYKTEDWEPIEQVARSFDDWATENSYRRSADFQTYVLTDHGRELLRELFSNTKPLVS